ncbi:MAG TPA: glycosyltransferase family 2 protein [Acidimicrobiales bacterium]|nr:glycosyltransferase family 2 protein [Acidimicrobiales bacterium]
MAVERIGRDEVELSIVVPAYNEAGNVPEFLRRVVPILRENVASYEIVFAVDPSTDGTEQLIIDAHEKNPAVKLLAFSRRFGQPTATMAGIEHASGRAVVVMDVDLQDPPELVVDMLKKWREGYDVVYAQRRERTGETRIKKLVAKVGYKVIARFGEVEIPRDTGDFRLMDRRVVDELLRFQETHGFLRGLVALVGFKQTAVLFDRPARYSGKGNYNQFVGSLRIGLNGLVAFSSALLNVSTIVGFLAAAGAFLTALVYVLLKVTGTDFPLGNPTIVVLVLFVGGVQLICLGIVGQYVGRIYDEVKRRPRYIVDRAIGFAEPSRVGREIAAS